MGLLSITCYVLSSRKHKSQIMFRKSMLIRILFQLQMSHVALIGNTIKLKTIKVIIPKYDKNAIDSIRSTSKMGIIIR